MFDTILATSLGIGLMFLFVFAVLPFFINNPGVQWIAHVKNPLCVFLGLYGLRRAVRHRILLWHLERRLRLAFVSIFVLSFCSCAANTGLVKPNIEPVAVSNKATSQSIRDTRSEIKVAQGKSAAGASALQKADANLSALLNESRHIVVIPVVIPVGTPTPTPIPTPIPTRSLMSRIFGPR